MKFYRYFYDTKEPFSKITDIGSSDVQEYLKFINDKSLASRTYNIDYIKKRIAIEEEMRAQFIAKGGKPKLKHPNYMVLENCDYWFYDVKNMFASMVLDSSLFPKDVISFTYGDSIPTFDDAFFDGKEYRKTVYTMDEIKALIDKYSLPQLWNANCKYGPENYIEVQIWSDEVFSNYNIKDTKDIFKTLNLFFDTIIDGNKSIKASLNSFPEQISLEEIKYNNFYYINKLYDKFKNIYIKDKMHGIEHAFRSAVYMLLIGKMAKVDEEFLETMLITAFAHDIGRKYSKTQEHGIIGAQILPEFIEHADMEIIQTAITSHSIEDWNLYMKINSKGEKENKLILWLKDVDTLDYIRFGAKGYNPNLLRTIEARKLVKFAAQLNFYMYTYPNDDYKLLKNEES